jgi:hypothetical protein
MKNTRFGIWLWASKWRFILISGVLFWGFGCALLMTLWRYVSGEPFHPVLFILWPIGGIGWGWYMWRWAERRQKTAHSVPADTN